MSYQRLIHLYGNYFVAPVLHGAARGATLDLFAYYHQQVVA